MTGSTHMAGGATAVMVYAAVSQANLSPITLLAAGAIGIVGGLFPDIDHPSSKISQKLPWLSRMISSFCGHRGLIHSPLLYLFLWLGWIWLAPAPYQFWGNMFLLGAASHLLLDMLNSKGIPVFAPLSKKRIHLARIKLGGVFETSIQLTLILTAASLLLRQCF